MLKYLFKVNNLEFQNRACVFTSVIIVDIEQVLVYNKNYFSDFPFLYHLEMSENQRFSGVTEMEHWRKIAELIFVYVLNQKLVIERYKYYKGLALGKPQELEKGSKSRY